MDHIDIQLTSHLYRIDCPKTEDLGEYYLDMLPEDQSRAINQHVGLCPHCSQELIRLKKYMADLAPELEYTLREKIQILVARLIPDNLDTNPSTAASPVLALRGENERPLMYEVDGYQLNLEVQDDPAKPGYKTILGLLIGGEDSVFQADLWQNGRSLQQAAIDDLGNFVFTGVLAGTYDIILSHHAAEIHVQAFQI